MEPAPPATLTVARATAAAYAKASAASPGQNVTQCNLCAGRLYPFERVPAGGKFYHKRCLRCRVCGVNLAGVHFSWIAHEGCLFCPADVPPNPSRVVVNEKAPGWAAKTYFDRLAGMSDVMLSIINLLRPHFAPFVTEQEYTERYVAWGKQLVTLKRASKFFCVPLAKWNNCGLADYAAYLVARERGAEALLNGRASGWAQVLATGELDRWEHAEARRLHSEDDKVRLAARVLRGPICVRWLRLRMYMYRCTRVC